MKKFGFVLTALLFSSVAMASEETIRSQMTDASFGEQIVPAELKGHYVGTCYAGSYERKEALFVDAFVNAKGIRTDLAISTEHLYGGSSLPEKFEFLLTNTVEGRDFMSEVVNLGYSGTDNNIERLAEGADFKFLYSSTATDKTLTVSVSKYRYCNDRGFCNPPMFDACTYGSNTFAGCIRNNDKTVFKKVSEGVLISHRTADSIGTRTNNYSFYRSPISRFCKWEKSL